MPTPVNTARQCLTDAAAAALDEAVGVARRRGHSQTTSLHMVSSLLSLPSSSLREACTRTRNNAYSIRVQFKALELSLSVSLDRLPCSQSSRVEEPPVSNSLMAAVKRSQANQRRQPENFSFYQQQYSSCSSPPVVKVELKCLVLSILDDPLVSRVFAEAGFRSCDVKMAMLRPVSSLHGHHVFGFSSRYKRPLYLYSSSCSTSNSEYNGSSFSFPFMGCFSGDENTRRISEVMVKTKKRNPVLLGVSAGEALRSFLETVQEKNEGVLPDRLSGLSVVGAENEVSRCGVGDCDEGLMKLRFEEMRKMVENLTSVESGVVVSLGDFKVFAEDGAYLDGLRFLVREFARLLEVCGGKLWLIGAAASDEIYTKLLNRFPSIEEDLDLEVLPITSLKFPMARTFPRSSLMGSFVPLAGFFSAPSEVKSPLNSSFKSVVRCDECNEKCEQEMKALSSRGLNASLADLYQSSLPSWLQTTGLGTNSSAPAMKAKDDGLLLSAKVSGAQTKWDDICRSHKKSQPPWKSNIGQISPRFPRIPELRVVDERDANVSDVSRNYTNPSSSVSESKSRISSFSIDMQQGSPSERHNPSDVLSKAKLQTIVSDSAEKSPTIENNPLIPLGPSSTSINDGHTSPSSITSVATNLGLGMISPPLSREPGKPVEDRRVNHANAFSGHISDHPSQQYSFSSTCSHRHLNPRDFKMLYKALLERVGHQDNAIGVVVEGLTYRKESSSRRGDLWFNFRGPDMLGQKRLALALAEVLYGSPDSMICVDLSTENEMTRLDAFFNLKIANKYEKTIRGGTAVDYLAEKLSKKPSVVFLENIEHADPVVKDSLSQAVKTGRLSDLRGREVNISNSIFLITSKLLEGSKNLSVNQELPRYTEEDILEAKCLPIQMLIGFDLSDDIVKENSSQLNAMNKRCSNPILISKRKPDGVEGSSEMAKRAHGISNSYLDLNLPADAIESFDNCLVESDSDSVSENNRSWLEDFVKQIDQVVVFKPIDFDALAEKTLEDMHKCLQETAGTDCLIEVEPEVMEQILAAIYLTDKMKVQVWIQNVVRQGFVEAMEKFSLSSRSIVKLVTYECCTPEKQIPDHLPARIILN